MEESKVKEVISEVVDVLESHGLEEVKLTLIKSDSDVYSFNLEVRTEG